MLLKKNMIPGNKINYFFIIFILFFFKNLNAEEKIISTPLINLKDLKPSFEELEEKNEIIINQQNIKEKKKKNNILPSSYAILIGLDKITAKSSEIIVNIDKAKRFGPLEIKVLKCGKVKLYNKLNDVAYLQVKDLTKSENEKVYIFNGWTFSADPNLTPFDHAIYDLQLVNCFNT